MNEQELMNLAHEAVEGAKKARLVFGDVECQPDLKTVSKMARNASAVRKYHNTCKGRLANRKANKAYHKTEKGKATMAKAKQAYYERNKARKLMGLQPDLLTPRERQWVECHRKLCMEIVCGGEVAVESLPIYEHDCLSF